MRAPRVQRWMLARRRPALAMLIAMIAGVGADGCSGSLFQSKLVPPTTYLLSAQLTPGSGATETAQRQANPRPPLAADLAVLRPRVRAGLETDRIAALYPDRRLDYFADARWSGPLDQVVQDLLVQAFDTGAHLRNVGAETSAFPSGYWLEVQVGDFQAEYASAGSAPTVNVHFLARLGTAGDRRVLLTVDAAARQGAADNRMTAIVEAYERAADSALAKIVTDASNALSADLQHEVRDAR